MTIRLNARPMFSTRSPAWRSRLTAASLLLAVLTACSVTPPAGTDVTAQSRTREAPTIRRLVTGLNGAQGSAIGPGGALYVTEPSDGRIVRIDSDTGAVTTFASGLPATLPQVGIGGVMDVAFIGHTAYALVTLVGPDLGGHNAVGIYRIDSPTTSTLIADIGAFSLAHPPRPGFRVFIYTGVQYALQPYEGGFLVTDGHHNRVLRVTLDGHISELIAFDDIVPTGLAVSGNTVYMAEAGPIPHLPQNGKVVAFRPPSKTAMNVAAGARLLVDVEFGRGRTLFGLAQGLWTGPAEGFPAQPNTGSLVRAERDGTFTVVAEPLDRPTSMEIIGTTAYIVTLGGEVYTVDHIAGPPYGASVSVH